MIAPESTREDVLAAFDVSRETSQRLDSIVAELDAWRRRMSLVGAREWPHIWARHVADSLQLVPIVGDARSVLDLGSGAGFPGLVLAAALHGRSDVTLVESVGKKCAFLRAAGDAAGLVFHVKQSRIESLPPSEVSVVTARALAPLPSLLDLAAPWLLRGACGVFPKGENWEEELTRARQRWTFACEVIPSRTSPAGRILKLSEISRV